MVDISPDQARRADESYDVRGMVGHAPHPEVLERAGARDAEIEVADGIARGLKTPGAFDTVPLARWHGVSKHISAHNPSWVQ